MRSAHTSRGRVTGRESSGRDLYGVLTRRGRRKWSCTVESLKSALQLRRESSRRRHAVERESHHGTLFSYKTRIHHDKSCRGTTGGCAISVFNSGLSNNFRRRRAPSLSPSLNLAHHHHVVSRCFRNQDCRSWSRTLHRSRTREGSGKLHHHRHWPHHDGLHLGDWSYQPR